MADFGALLSAVMVAPGAADRFAAMCLPLLNAFSEKIPLFLSRRNDFRSMALEILGPAGARVASNVATVAALVAVLETVPGWKFSNVNCYFPKLVAQQQHDIINTPPAFAGAFETALQHMSRDLSLFSQHVNIVKPVTHNPENEEVLAVTNQNFLRAAKAMTSLSTEDGALLTYNSLQGFSIRHDSKQRFPGNKNPVTASLVSLTKLRSDVVSTIRAALDAIKV